MSLSELTSRASSRRLPWLSAGQAFPPLEEAWSDVDPAPGLLAAGETLDVATLIRAYSNGIFPWFSQDQPVLWWSPDPRMVLQARNFRLHRSLRKAVVHFLSDPRCEIRINSAFQQVVEACAGKPRPGQSGTWIVPGMQVAYLELHRAGCAHSVETWVNGELAGGLYCINLGTMVFGESMFAHQTDASKIALAALVAFCRASSIEMIDCQQNTSHLASLGAGEIRRAEFSNYLRCHVSRPAPEWHFDPLCWDRILTSHPRIRHEAP